MESRIGYVLDSDGFLITPVQVTGENGTESIKYYTLKSGEQLIDAPPPGWFVKTKWDGNAWIEGATPEEIEEWEKEHPADPGPSELDQLREQVAAQQELIDILIGGSE